jgi:multidrug transporter EmrE-like cation transporter
LTAILALVASIFTWKIGYFVRFMLNHDRLLIDLTCYAILNAMGALFIYKLVSIFRQHIYPMVAELRRCLTICLNVIWYGHHLAAMQWFGIFIVFAGIMVEIISNYSLTSRILPNDNIRNREGKNYNKIIAKEEGWSARKYEPDEINDDVEGI